MHMFIQRSGMKDCLSHVEGSTVTVVIVQSAIHNFTMPCLFQHTAYTLLQRFYNALLITFYRDFIMSSLYHFTEILQCPAYTILQRYYGDELKTISIKVKFTKIL